MRFWIGPFKQFLTERETELDARILAKYARLHLPKYVWLLEMSFCAADRLDEIVNAGPERPVIGEFLYDTTTPAYATRPVVLRVGPFFITDVRGHGLTKGPVDAEDMAPEERGELDALLRKSFIERASLRPRRCFTGSPQDEGAREEPVE